MPSDWYLINTSNYYSGHENDEFSNNATDAFQELINNSPESYDISIGEVSKRVIIQSSTKFNERTLLTEIGEVSIGDLIVWNGEKWLIVERPLSNKMYEQSTIQLCNNTLTLSSVTKTVSGYDSMGRPIYSETFVDDNYPCVVKSRIQMVDDNYINNAINVPEGTLMITIGYADNHDIEIGKEFSMYGKQYKISSLDYTNFYNEKGVITLLAELIT